MVARFYFDPSPAVIVQQSRTCCCTIVDCCTKNDTAASEVASKYGIEFHTLNIATYRYLTSLRFEKLAHDNYDLEYASQLDKSLPDCFLNEGNESCNTQVRGLLH